ncbi:MAG: hypothetical protein RLZZ486_542 [Actinomycetota bacterium]
MKPFFSIVSECNFMHFSPIRKVKNEEFNLQNRSSYNFSGGSIVRICLCSSSFCRFSRSSFSLVRYWSSSAWSFELSSLALFQAPMLLPTDINHRCFQVKLQIKDGKTLILCCRWAQVLARVYNKPVGCAHFPTRAPTG